MKAAKIREHTDEELGQLHRETRKQLFDLRAMRSAGGEKEQPLRARTLRRDIARILTVSKEREPKHGRNDKA
jgi:large subunit ribosomal protein L29